MRPAARLPLLVLPLLAAGCLAGPPSLEPCATMTLDVEPARIRVGETMRVVATLASCDDEPVEVAPAFCGLDGIVARLDGGNDGPRFLGDGAADAGPVYALCDRGPTPVVTLAPGASTSSAFAWNGTVHRFDCDAAGACGARLEPAPAVTYRLVAVAAVGRGGTAVQAEHLVEVAP